MRFPFMQGMLPEIVPQDAGLSRHGEEFSPQERETHD
jgi:hypothetical protein